ncbi:response regulator transcription factor [Sandarakinorhabdus oryzae]|uniref:response regulator transcription factor n=1 Tax=Sandarakinorhabdus oryzae TaxID=2675220 RepID=UPI0012E2E9D9|nr:response regulator [Sandarakinorhabdus oryzae]
MADDPIIHVIDDDESLRSALLSLLASVGFAGRGHASVSDFLAAERPDAPGCLVLDVRMPGMNGLDMQDRFDELGIAQPAVLMSGHGDIPMSVRAMKAGAVDFLVKPFRDQDLLDAVTAAVAQDRKRRAQAVDDAELRRRHASLSPREQQVMALVVAGQMNKQAAYALDLSEVTVKIHRGAAMRKMGARTLPDLVRMAERLALLGQ